MTIAESVEQQDAATREIAANSRQAAEGTETVTDNIRIVGSSIHKVEEVGHTLQAVVDDLDRQAKVLREEVDLFLSGIRTA
ncbi:hypothetical protein D3C71_2121640 [compost metagenome]